MYNKMELNEMFGLDNRAKNPLTGKIERIHIKRDEKVPDAVVFDIWLEDHTLGNTLRMELLRNELVLFAGYKVPHPLENKIELRVQTLPKTTPEAAVRLAVKNIKSEFKSMLEQFDVGVAALQAEAAKKEAPPPPRQLLDAAAVPLPREDEEYSPVYEGSPERRLDEGLRELAGLGPTSEASPEYSPSTPPGDDGEGADDPMGLR